MKALIAAAVLLAPAFASANDVLKAPWVTSAVGQLAPELSSPAAKPAQPGAASTGQTEALHGGSSGNGRLAYVLRQRNLTIKDVLRERPRRTKKAPRKS